MAGGKEEGRSHQDYETEPSAAAGDIANNDSSSNNHDSTHPGASTDLITKLLVKRVVGFLEQKPSDFAITLLPDSEPSVAGTEKVRRNESPVPASDSLASLSSEERTLLEASTALMTEPNRDAPSKHIGHLGLDARHLPQIARILRTAYFRARETFRTASLASSSAPSRKTPARYWSEAEELFRITSCLLLIQPDHVTAWADRRRCLLRLQYRGVNALDPVAYGCDNDGCVQSQTDDSEIGEAQKQASLDLWNQELDYLDLLVTQHSKAPSSWSHRKYVLRHLFRGIQKSSQPPNKTKEELFSREVRTCTEVAEKFPKNYYAWTHRRNLWDLFAFDEMDTGNGADGGDAEQPVGSERKREMQQQEGKKRHQRYTELLETELVVGLWQDWLPKHPADHSAVHYSCQVLDLVLGAIAAMPTEGTGERDARIESISIAALETVRSLLSKHSSNDYESLWILRRLTCKTLWERQPCRPVEEERTAAAETPGRRLVRDDLALVLSSTLGANGDKRPPLEEAQRQAGPSGAVEGTPIDDKNDSMHAWTFLAWCLGNLSGINERDDEHVFTKCVGAAISGHLTATAQGRATSTPQHNVLMYTSASSPLLEMLKEGTV